MLLNNSITQKDDLYQYLNDINYGMSKPNFLHLYNNVKGLITVNGTISLTRISEEILTSKHFSSISRFLSKYKWDENLINRNRISYLNYYLENNIKSDSIGFLAIDDTVNPKLKSSNIEGIGFNHSHTLGKSVKSHCIVSSNFICGNISIPVDYEFYLNRDNCEKLNKEFKSKHEIAIDLIRRFERPTNCKKLYCLTDNWYTSYKLIKFCIDNNILLIGAIKPNRLIAPNGKRVQIKEFVKKLDLTTLDVVTIKDRKYRIFSCVTTLGKTDIKAKLVLCFEVGDDELNHPLYLISTDFDLTPRQIVIYYQKRWKIEVNYKYLKSYLGFAEYRIRKFKAINRYILLTFLAINFLILYSRKYNIETTLGKAIRHFQKMAMKDLIEGIYYLIKNNYDLNKIYKELKLEI